MTKTYDDEHVSTCWAYNVQRQRCGLGAGHMGDHAIEFTWSDDECFDPNDLPVPYVAPSGGRVVTMNMSPAEAAYQAEADLLDDLGSVPNGSCFSCGCLEELHPCDAHQCKSFVL